MRSSRIIAALVTASLCGVGNADTTTSIATGLAYPTMAQSNEAVTDDFDDKLYFTTDFGFNWVPDIEVNTFINVPGAVIQLIGGSAELDLGFRWDIGIGYEFTENFRVQVESGYIKNNFDSVSGTATRFQPPFTPDTVRVSASLSGSLTQVPIMLAAIYQFGSDTPDRSDKSTAAAWRFRPYVGAGLGAVYVDSDFRFDLAGQTVRDSRDDWVFGYQALAGLEYELSNDWYLNISYRFLGLDGSSELGTNAIYNHSLQFGLRIEF